MAGGNLYKIRLKSGRVVGPVDISRVSEIIAAGHILGEEEIARAPDYRWQPITKFPEIVDLVLSALEKQGKAAPESLTKVSLQAPEPEPSASESSPDATVPLPKDQTYNQASSPKAASDIEIDLKDGKLKDKKAKKREKSTQSVRPIEEKINPYGDVPTLVNIPRKVDPDLERTKVTDLSTTGREGIQQYVEDATRVIETRHQMPLVPEKGEKVPLHAALGIEPEKPRLISRKVVYFIVACLMMTFYLMQQETKTKDAVAEMVPRSFQFRPVQINIPAEPKDKKINAQLSIAYLDKAMRYFNSDTPAGYIQASNLLYKAVFNNPENIVARSLLAISYMRVAEIVPRNAKFFKTVSELVKQDPARKSYPVEFFLAQAEYEMMMERPERALQIIEGVAKRSPTPAVLHMQAEALRTLGERNRAIATITRALKMVGTEDRSPRQLLFYARLLEEKEQWGAALTVLRSYLPKNPGHGAGLLVYARILFRNNDHGKAIATLLQIIDNPYRVDPPNLAQSFLLAARIFESKQRLDQALRFAKAAKVLMPSDTEAEDLIFRIRARNPRSKALYELLTAAKEKERAKEYTEAMNVYIRAREKDTTSPVPLFYLARLYEAVGKPQMAIELYKKITLMPKKSVDAFFNLADLYIRRYELDEAMTLMRTLQGDRSMRKSARVTHMLGRIAYYRGDPSQARAFYTAAIESGARIPELYVDMAQLEEEEKDVITSEFFYTVALRYDLFNEDALLGIAMSRFYKNTPSDAIRFLEAKLYARPNSPQILTNLALIHLRSGNRELGKQYLQKAVQSDRKYARAYRLMGNLVKEEGDRQSDFEERKRSYKFSLASYTAYSKLAPNEPDGYMAAAELYFYVRDLGAAAKNYEKVLSLAPNYPRARLQLAKIARNGQDPDTALNLVNEEIRRHSKSPEAFVELGKIRLAKKEYPLASEALTTAAKLNPKNVDAIVHLGYVHYLQGSYQSAIALFERAQEIDPLQEDIHWKIGLAYEKDGKKAKAIAAFKNFQGLVTDPEKIDKVRQRILKIQSQM